MDVGKHVVMIKADYQKIYRLKNKNLRLGREKINLIGAVGHPYCSVFRLKPQVIGQAKCLGLERCKRQDYDDYVLQLQKSETVDQEDNRNVHDSNTAQKLTKDEIDNLKSEGLRGQELVDKLVENSSSFGEKTEFSQEKYLKRKEQKYGDFVILHRPTVRMIVSCLYKENPFQVANLREDTLALTLNTAGVRAGGKFLLLEDGTEGIVLAGMLERMGNSGRVIQLHQLDCPRAAVTMSDLAPGVLENVVLAVRLSSLLKLNDEVNNGDSAELTGYKKIENIALTELRNNDFDGLIIATKSHPKSILSQFLQFLSPSAPFVVYSPYIDVLKECFAETKVKSSIANERISETWFRDYQVLSGRTHPEMNMSGGGGYLFSGIKTLPVPQAVEFPEAIYTGKAKNSHILFDDEDNDTSGVVETGENGEESSKDSPKLDADSALIEEPAEKRSKLE